MKYDSPGRTHTADLSSRTVTVKALTPDDLMQHADSLYRFAVSKVGDHHAAQDLVQDVLGAAWQKSSPSWQKRALMIPWIISISSTPIPI